MNTLSNLLLFLIFKSHVLNYGRSRQNNGDF
jgi:hypothetical protein